MLNRVTIQFIIFTKTLWRVQRGLPFYNSGGVTDIRHTEMYLNGSHACNMFSMVPHTQSKRSVTVHMLLIIAEFSNYTIFYNVLLGFLKLISFPSNGNITELRPNVS